VIFAARGRDHSKAKRQEHQQVSFCRFAFLTAWQLAIGNWQLATTHGND